MPRNPTTKSGVVQDPEASSNVQEVDDSPSNQHSDPVIENQTQEQDQSQLNEVLQRPVQPNPGQFFQGSHIQWIPVQVQPAQSTTGSTESVGPGGGSTAGSGSAWSYPNSNLSGPMGLPYPGFGPSFFPFAGTFGGRPEPGDALYTAATDGPQLRLISQQLSGPENYSVWSRELRRALITKDRDGFIDGSIPIPADERLARHWKKCNQLVRTWIGNC